MALTLTLSHPTSISHFSTRHLPVNPTLHVRLRLRPLPSLASLTGSTPTNPEWLPDSERKKKKRTVAGVDQEELLDPELLADPDSFFCDLNGVQIHHKICQHEENKDDVQSENSVLPICQIQKFRFPMILLHGFGASVFSWDRVMKPLARLTGSKVLAFDRPAFGLTSRVNYLGEFSSKKTDATPLNPYSMAFSVMATLSFMKLLDAEKTILVAHSAGCLVAANTYFEAPEQIAALIFIAPAIIAPFVRANSTKENKTEKNSEGNSDIQENFFFRIWKSVVMLYMSIAWLVAYFMKAVKDMVSLLYKKILSAILRSAFAVTLVRVVMDKFGILGVRNAWYDSSLVTDHVIQGYTKPLRAKGWERALLEYTLAILTDSISASQPPLTKRLSSISCPVLIITGDSDRIVPAWNASRLSAAIPGSVLKVMKDCGHLPHEEKCEEFLSAVNKFLDRFFGVSGEAALGNI